MPSIGPLARSGYIPGRWGVVAVSLQNGQSGWVPAGGPHDDPITDIVTYHLPVFGASDVVIAEIVTLGGRRALYDTYKMFDWTPLSEAQIEALVAFRDQLVAEGRQRGWEVDRILQDVRDEQSGA